MEYLIAEHKAPAGPMAFFGPAFSKTVNPFTGLELLGVQLPLSLSAPIVLLATFRRNPTGEVCHRFHNKYVA